MPKLFVQLIAIFALTQLLGIAVGINWIDAIATGKQPQPTVLGGTENPDDPINAIALVLCILVFTAFLLVFMHFFKGRLLFKFLETMVTFTASWIVFEVFIGDFWLIFSIILVAWRLLRPKHVLLRNAAAIISIAGVGALIGVTLGVIPVAIFLILLGCYDFIAVFKTKHMVTLAKGITKQNLAFTVAMPTPKHQFELGTGDLALPLVFAVSTMKASQAIGFPSYLVPAGMILTASLIGLLITIDYSSKHVGKALPALPLQAVLMLGAFALSKAIGF